MFLLCLHNISVTSGFEEYSILIMSSAELMKGPKKTQGFFCPLIPFLRSPNTSIGDSPQTCPEQACPEFYRRSRRIHLRVPFIPNLFAPLLFSRRRHDDVVIPAKLVHSRKQGAGILIVSPLHRRGFPTSRDSFLPA